MADHERLLDDLNEHQREAVTTPVAPLVVLAGAGSGKTRVLTRRIAWQAAEGRVDARRTMAVTFTRKAAGELTARLAALGLPHPVTAGTFHALALGQLRRRWADRREAEPTLLDRKVRLLVPMLPNSPTVGLEAAEVAGEIEWAKARVISPTGYESAIADAGRATPRPPEELAALYERYERDKSRRGLVDFDDLLAGLAEALETDGDFASATRWRYRHLFVDEFQDVNPAQFRLIRAWLGSGTDLCVVGDNDQAIYGFSGADASYLVGFRTHFPGAATVRLEENYRSTPQILAAANAVLPAGRRIKGHLTPTLPDGPLPSVVCHPTDSDEARAVAAALGEAHSRGAAWSSMAVLYRTNAQSAPFELALRAAGVPYAVQGAARFLDRPEVAAALDELRRQPTHGFAAALDGLGEWAAELAADRRDHAEAVVRLGRDYLAGGPAAPSLAGFVDHLATAMADDPRSAGADAVDLLTFHKAKGLEWRTVFVTGLERGFVPIAYAETPAALAEERRLLYVAITRAEVELHLSWAARRTLGARLQARQASPYLAPIEAALGAVGPGGDGDWRAAVAAQRARLAELRATARSRTADCGPEADPVVLAGLVEWRRGLARASGVPAQVIFHDATLRAIAAARPESLDALLRLPGLGPVKVTRYGDALLDILRTRAAS